MLRGGLCVLVSVALFWPLGLWVWWAAETPDPERTRVRELFCAPGACQPEPGERLTYFAAVAFFPAALLGCALVCRWWDQRRLRVPALVVWLAELALGYLLLLLFKSVWRWDRVASPFALILFYRYPLTTLPLLAASLALLWWGGAGSRLRRILHPASHVLVLAVLALVALVCLFDHHGPYASHVHFNAMFQPVVQVWQGGALLIDCVSQYGLYPHLLQPLFAVIGLSVLTFSAVMALLTAGSYAALWAFLSRAARNRAAALAGFLALVFHNWWYATSMVGDLYFQYHPLRLVFPAILVFLAYRYLRRPTRPLYWGSTLFLAAGVLWNADSGLPALLSWVGFLVFGDLCGPDRRAGLGKALLHLGAAAGSLAGVAALYTAAICVRYGALPDFGQMFLYQRLFYLAGFQMMPMPLPGTWMLVVLVYLAGLASSAFALLAGTATARTRMVFLLSILGTGLFSYYQGRSHLAVLNLVCWPCFLLMTLFLDDLIVQLQAGERRPLPWLVAGVLAWILAGSAWSIAPDTGTVAAIARTNLVLAWAGTPVGETAPVEREAALLREAVPPGGRALVMSCRDGLLQLLAGARSLSPCAFSQMVLAEDFLSLCRTLPHRPDVSLFVDREILQLETGRAGVHLGTQFLARLLLGGGYEVTAVTPNGYLFHRRGNSDQTGTVTAQPLSIGFRDGMIGSGLACPPLFLALPFSLEMVVKPGESQVPGAALVGECLPGAGAGGLAIYHEAGRVYALHLGDGKRERVLLRFELEPGRWSHLAVIAEPNTVHIHVNGRETAVAATSGLAVSDSALALCIGNGADGARPFNGLIREAAILNRALTRAEVGARAKEKKNLPQRRQDAKEEGRQEGQEEP